MNLSEYRLCLSLFFLSAGTGIGAWASSLPLLAAEAELNKGELGALLLRFAPGAILLMTVAGRFVDKLATIVHSGSWEHGFRWCVRGNSLRRQLANTGVSHIRGRVRLRPWTWSLASGVSSFL